MLVRQKDKQSESKSDKKGASQRVSQMKRMKVRE